MLYIYITGYVLIWPIRAFLLCVCIASTFLFCFCYLEWGSKYTCFIFMKEEFKWRTMKTGNVKGNQRLKHWANDYPRFWPKRGCWQSKQNNVTERNRSQERNSRCSPTVLEMVRYTAGSQTAVNENGRLTEPLQITVIWLSTDSRYSKAADESCVYQKGILVQKKSSVIGGRRIFLTKMSYHRRQGYLPKPVTKMNEIPTTFESSVVK